jgi:transcriptional regulator with XRE-family HTH domain
VAKCLGEIVSRLRTGIQLRREEAAYRAWISPDYWYAIERGRRLPSLAVFIMLSRSLGLDPRELLDGLLKRMHYGYGAPPVFQPSVRELSTESEREFKRLMDAVRGKRSEAA